jgi:Cytochrome oxidase c assembly
MSRSASDAYTRFTSTSPHASSKPSSSSKTSPPFGSYQPSAPRPSQPSSFPPGPPNETPQEKVARLRLASRLAKSRTSMSPLDRAIDRGRRIADKTHRIFAYGLIGSTGTHLLNPHPYIILLITKHQSRYRNRNCPLRNDRPHPPQPPPEARLDRPRAPEIV